MTYAKTLVMVVGNFLNFQRILKTKKRISSEKIRREFELFLARRKGNNGFKFRERPPKF
ncbi:MAG: hypothetical protein Q8N98_01805 [bacterium]|nr:hypothetical protein [bacterium]